MLIRRLAVVGTGLIGTSVALAARGAGVDVVLHDVDPGAAGGQRDGGADQPGADDRQPADQHGRPARRAGGVTARGRGAALAPRAGTRA